MSQFEFKPNLTPRQVIEQGAFGGCYFGLEIDEYIDYNYTSLFEYHFKGLDTSLYLGETYKPKVNKFKIRSGMDYRYWKDKGWMNERDPYGWFEWYCKFDLGLRGEDDNRQIGRWQDFCGTNGRWRNRIYSMIWETGDWSISPRIQQSLLHWGYKVNEEDYDLWKLRNNKKSKIVEQEMWDHYSELPNPSWYENKY